MEKFNVLYVEDDIEVSKSIVTAMKHFFNKIDHAQNGQEGYDLFLKNKYDFIITDINMPVLNGLDMISKIRISNEDIPIIITSVHSESNYFTKSIDLNIDGYVLKPINTKHLFNVIKKIAKRINEGNSNLKNLKLLQEYKNAIDDSTIVSKTDIKGIITYANEAFVKSSGYSIDELMGENHNIIKHPDTPKGIFADMWDTILNKNVWKGRVKNRKKNGEHYWLNVTISPILDEYNNIIEFIAIRNDITLEVEYKKNLELKVKEKVKELREKDKVLHQQSKLAAMGEMIDAIAHQWKQPISIIQMKTDMIGYDYKDGLLDDSAINIFQSDVNSQIVHILDTLKEFRSFLRPNKRTQEFSVKHTVNSVLTLVKDELFKNTISTKVIVNEDMVINGIENEFKHVILNIINNAKDAFVDNNCNNRDIVITLEKNRITIQDNAGGIPKDVISNIFEANITTKGEGKGTGIGLYISKQIVEKIHAQIYVENIDNGACFTILC